MRNNKGLRKELEITDMLVGLKDTGRFFDGKR